jgi:hypothetical protein
VTAGAGVVVRDAGGDAPADGELGDEHADVTAAMLAKAASRRPMRISEK